MPVLKILLGVIAVGTTGIVETCVVKNFTSINDEPQKPITSENNTKSQAQQLPSNSETTTPQTITEA